MRIAHTVYMMMVVRQVVLAHTWYVYCKLEQSNVEGVGGDRMERSRTREGGVGPVHGLQALQDLLALLALL